MPMGDGLEHHRNRLASGHKQNRSKNHLHTGSSDGQRKMRTVNPHGQSFTEICSEGQTHHIR